MILSRFKFVRLLVSFASDLLTVAHRHIISLIRTSISFEPIGRLSDLKREDWLDLVVLIFRVRGVLRTVRVDLRVYSRLGICSCYHTPYENFLNSSYDPTIFQSKGFPEIGKLAGPNPSK